MKYAKEMIRNNTPRPKYSSLLDQEVKRRHSFNWGGYIILTGEGGIGKTSILISWWDELKKTSAIPTFMFLIGTHSYLL